MPLNMLKKNISVNIKMKLRHIHSPPLTLTGIKPQKSGGFAQCRSGGATGLMSPGLRHGGGLGKRQ
jgi:hypothetical protein